MKKQWNEYVRELMDRNGINQNDIADAIGKTQGAVGHWLTGKGSLILMMLQRSLILSARKKCS